jgi:hypothetical protein
VAALGAAAGSSGAAPKKARIPAGPSAAVKALAQNCDAHRFETTIHLTVEGVEKQSKVRLCGTEGQSDADWIRTLKDAVGKTAASNMPQVAKDQIVAAVNAEIARLTHPALQLQDGADISKLPKSAVAKPEVPLSRDYGALPPLPTASAVPPPNVLGPAGVAGVPAPRLTLRCALAGDEDRPSTCDSIDKDTVLVLRADGAYPNGLAVRFLRHGDQRAELELPALKPGETANVRLPPAVCTGVVRSKLEIQALGGNAPSGTMGGTVGEYDLRC